MLKFLWFSIALLLVGLSTSTYGMLLQDKSVKKMYPCRCHNSSTDIFDAISKKCSACFTKYDSQIFMTKFGGQNPLHYAALQSRFIFVEMLVDVYLLNVNEPTPDYQWTPLHCICSRAYNQTMLTDKGHIELEELLEDFDDKYDYQEEIAYYNESLKILKFLLQHGADRILRDKNGKTPFLIAVEKGFRNIVKMLLEEPLVLSPTVNLETLKQWCACSPRFKDDVFTFLCVLKYFQIKKNIKITKYIVWSIFVKIFPEYYVEQMALIPDRQTNKSPLAVAQEKKFKGIVTLLEPYEKGRIERDKNKQKIKKNENRKNQNLDCDIF